MRRIINNLLYDTDASKVLYIDEDTHRVLYQTQNGNFFMFYPTGEITPKTVDATKEYLGKYAVDVYIEVFGEPKGA